jgi:hypothetical protein
MLMKVMGHTDARTPMRYQHPALDPVRHAIDQRNLPHNSSPLSCESNEEMRK